MHSHSHLLTFFVSALIFFTAAGCDGASENSEGNGSDISGRYEATTLTDPDNPERRDILAKGGALALRLEEAREDPFPSEAQSFGELSGTFVVPAELSESGRRQSYDLNGTYLLEGDSSRLTFDLESTEDFFIGDIDWTYEGDGVIRDDAENYTAVLERQ
jgi:hypothetical protein